MRLPPPRLPAAGWTLALGVTLLATAVSALPAVAATATTKAVDPETLPIPEGSAAPTTLSGGSGGTLLRLGLGLVVVVGLIALVWYVMKRIQRSRYPALDERGPSLIDVVATTSLGPNRALHLVRVGDEIVLVGATDHSVNVVTRIGAEDAAGLGDDTSRRPAIDDRERAVATATYGSMVDRLRAMTTRR